MTPKQQAVVDFYKGYNIPASWFVGEPATADNASRPYPIGTVEVIALGGEFIWSIIIEPDGTEATSEATVGEFSTGIEV
jgi:hypothetical protein